MDREKVERAKGKEDVYREREWARETRDTKTLFAQLREQVMQTDITALGREGTEEAPAQSASQAVETHMKKCFNKHVRMDADETQASKEERKKATEDICSKLRTHMSRKSEVDRRRIGEMSVERMFSEGNVRKAIKAVKEGTVPGKDGFPTEFYSKDEEVSEALVKHLSKLFTEVAENGDMTQAMKCAIVSILYKVFYFIFKYKGKGK